MDSTEEEESKTICCLWVAGIVPSDLKKMNISVHYDMQMPFHDDPLHRFTVIS